MPTYWTIQFFADPDGAPTAFVEKTFDDWQIDRPRLNRRSFETDEFNFNANNQDIDTPDLFPFGSKIVVQRNRTSSTAIDPVTKQQIPAANSFSGGSIYFQGVVTAQRRIGSPTSESVSYTVSGPWWYLKQDCYEQVIATLSFQPTTHVVLNMVTTGSSYGNNASISYQVDNILTNALSKFGAIFSYDVATFSDFSGVFPPFDEKSDLTYAEALRNEFKWCPRVVSWFDYTQAVPVLHIKTIPALETTTLNMSLGIEVVSEDIVPRYDLQIDQCWFRYEQTNTIDDISRFVVSQDVYPPTTTSKTGIMRATVNLFGAKGTEQFATLTTSDLVAAAGTDAYWKDKHPELNNYSNLVFHYPAVIVPASSLFSYDNEIVEGSFHNWMRVGNTNAGDPGVQGDAKVSVLCDYTDDFGNIVKDHALHVRVKTTNLGSGTFSRLRITTGSESVPVGLAEFFYNQLKVLPWEGEIKIEGEDVSSQQFLGCNLNITGGLAAWATMLATVNSVTEDLDEGSVTVKFGPNKWLSPSEIVDLLRVTRNRTNTIYSSTIVNGIAGSDDVLSPDNLGKRDSTKGSAEKNKTVHSYQNNQIVEDAINNLFGMSTNSPADGSLRLALSDLVANDSLN